MGEGLGWCPWKGLGEEGGWEVLQEEWIGDKISILKGLYSLRYCLIF